MKLVLAEPTLLKDSVSIISELVSEARFKVGKDAIELVAMDPANVAMVIYKLLSSSFAEYSVKEATALAINLNDLKAVLRRLKGHDTLTIEAESGKLKLTLKGAQTRTFRIPLLDVEDREQKIPDLSFDATVTLPSSTLTDAIEDMDIVGESVSFLVDSKALQVQSASELTTANVEIAPGEDTKIVAKGSMKSKYSIEYLKKMIAASKLADKAVLAFSKDYPLKLDYTVLNKLQLTFILAPRVDND